MNPHLLRSAIQHQLSRAVRSTHVKQDVSSGCESTEVLSLVQMVGSANKKQTNIQAICKHTIVRTVRAVTTRTEV